ncbi:MAG: Gfo/Idh/MocA family protein, partial [Planctomycetota bacterium]
MSAPAPLRTAIIGVSGFGDVHYQDLLREADAGRLQPVAATIINPDDEAEKCACLRNHGAALFVDYQEMLRQHAGGLDLCLIPTGIALHAPMSRAALAAGAHVYVEKPIAATVEDADAMAAAAEAAGRVLAVGYQNMYDPGLHVLKERIVAGAIGAVESVACWGCWPRPDSYYARNGWAGRLRVGEAWVLDAPFNNAFAHYVMLSLFLAGAEARTRARPTAVEAELYRARPAIESPDTAAIRVTTDEGPTVFL